MLTLPTFSRPSEVHFSADRDIGSSSPDPGHKPSSELHCAAFSAADRFVPCEEIGALPSIEPNILNLVPDTVAWQNHVIPLAVTPGGETVLLYIHEADREKEGEQTEHLQVLLNRRVKFLDEEDPRRIPFRRFKIPEILEHYYPAGSASIPSIRHTGQG